MKAVINRTIITCLIFSFLISFSQEKNVYLGFDKKKADYFLKEDGSGNIVTEQIYTKHTRENGDIIFYIKDLMFVYDKSIMLKRKISLEKFNENILSADKTIEYIKTVQEKHPFGYKHSSKEHPKMYIIDKSCKNEVILYQVNWQYYIE